MTIRMKLLSLGGLAIVALLVAAGLGIYSTEDTTAFKQAELEIARISTDMLTLRRREKDFLMRLDLKHRDHFETDYRAMQDRIERARHDLGGLGVDTSTLESVADYLQDYRDGFLQLVQTQEKIGLHPKAGLYGSLRNAVHAVEKKLADNQEYRLSKDMLMLRRREKDFMLRDDPKYVQKFEQDFVIMQEDLSSSTLSEGDRSAVQALLNTYRTDFLQLVEGYEERGLNPGTGLRGKVRDAAHVAENHVNDMAIQLANAIETRIVSGRNTILVITGLLIAAISAAIVLIIRGIIAPVSQLRSIMQQASRERDLSLRADMPGNDELSDMAQVYNQMTESFQDVVRQVIASSGQLMTTASEWSTLTTQSNASILRQQEESRSVATAMNEMNATVQEVARNANAAAGASQRADEQSSKGRAVVKLAVQDIQELAGNVENTSLVIKKLEEESTNIGTVLSVIQGIAEQTNLLALNAAIEAARAGEQGRGFAVVADEVRTLAQRSQESTEEIKGIIDRLQAGAKSAVNAMALGHQKTQSTVDNALAAGGALDAITEAVAEINGMNIQIAGAAEEQSAVAEEINRNVVNIADVAEETSSTINVVTQNSDSLEKLADELNGLIRQFKVST